MTMYEIITRQQVYSGQNPSLIIRLLMDGRNVSPNPEIVDEVEKTLEGLDLSIFHGLKKIMTKCWEADINKRPSSSQGLAL